jgi:hypothetical protein
MRLRCVAIHHAAPPLVKKKKKKNQKNGFFSCSLTVSHQFLAVVLSLLSFCYLVRSRNLPRRTLSGSKKRDPLALVLGSWFHCHHPSSYKAFSVFNPIRQPSAIAQDGHLFYSRR